MGNHSEGGLPDHAEQDPEKQRFREAQADVCQVSKCSCANTKTVFFEHSFEIESLFFPPRMDGVLKRVTESRNLEHRLRALENEVTDLLQHCCCC